MSEKSKLRVHFLGASGTVTGSKFLVETPDHKILVDCGLFQGLKNLRKLNWEYLPVNANEIDCVLLTHGHLDHSGFLPRLVKMGFKGPVLGTQPTLKIAEVILKDSGKIQEEEARRANKEGYSKHDPAMPLYHVKEAIKAIEHFSPVHTDKWYEIYPEIKVRYRYAGHIIGATFIEMDVLGRRLVFSGDLGRNNDLLMRAPEKPVKADYLFIESTYGNRFHPVEDIEKKLQDIIEFTYNKNGVLIIPSFAVERAQVIMYLLWKLKLKRAIPSLSMYMDSPMGADVLQIFQAYHDWHKISRADCEAMIDSFHIVEDYKQTWNLSNDKTPKIVIAGSGMLSGGRVLTYLQNQISRKETTVFLVGFQAEGTRGRALLEGAKEIKIYGKYYLVEADIVSDSSLSAHADQTGLLDWVSEIVNKPKKVFIIHGEAQAADAFRLKLTDSKGWDCVVPELYSIVELD